MTHKLILLACAAVALTYLGAMVYGGWLIGQSARDIEQRTANLPATKPGKKFVNG